MRYHLTPARMTIVKKSTNNKYWRGCSEKWTLLHCWWECKLIWSLWTTVWRFLKKLKIELSNHMTLQFHSWAYIQKEKKDLKSYMHPLFSVALFTIAKTWKQPKCASTEKWTKKMWYIYTMEYYSVIKKNEIIPFAATWMDLEIFIVNEVRQRINIIWHPFCAESKKKWYKWAYKTETGSQT